MHLCCLSCRGIQAWWKMWGGGAGILIFIFAQQALYLYCKQISYSLENCSLIHIAEHFILYPLILFLYCTVKCTFQLIVTLKNTFSPFFPRLHLRVTVLRSRHFLGRLRLRPTWVGFGSRQKKAAPGGSGSIH